jgi:hypothetical protein
MRRTNGFAGIVVAAMVLALTFLLLILMRSRGQTIEVLRVPETSDAVRTKSPAPKTVYVGGLGYEEPQSDRCFEVEPGGGFSMEMDGPIRLFENVLVLTGSFEMCGVDVNSGAPVWYLTTGDGPGNFAEVAPNEIYYGDKDVHGRINTQTGRILSTDQEVIGDDQWESEPNEVTLTVENITASIEPTAEGGELVVGDSTGRWRLSGISLGGMRRFGPWIIAGADDYSQLYAFDTRRPIRAQLDDLARIGGGTVT